MPSYTGVFKRAGKFYVYLDHKRKRYTPGSGFDTAEEAARWRTTKRAELQRGVGLGADMTFGDFALRYWRQYKESGHSPSTVRVVEVFLRTSLLPAFGSVKLRDITMEKVSRYRGDLLVKYAPKTAAEIIAILKRTLKNAVKMDIIAKNPAQFLDPIPRKSKEPNTLTPEQLKHLLDSSPIKERAIVGLAGLAGLRRSEVFAVRWEDIDFNANTLTVCRQCWLGTIKEPKTETSKGTLPLLDELVLILKEWKLRCGGDGWVFPGRKDMPFNPEWANRGFKALLRSCGLPPIRFHDLRHTFVTIMLNRGVPIIDVKYLARHSKVTMTERYAHKTPEHLESVVRNTRIFEDGLHRIKHRIDYV